MKFYGLSKFDTHIVYSRNLKRTIVHSNLHLRKKFLWTMRKLLLEARKNNYFIYNILETSIIKK